MVLPLLTLTLPAAEPQTEFVGQIVCSQCWFEADRNQVVYGTPADLPPPQ